MFDRISTKPAILSGQPTIRGMRLTVRRVIEALAIYPNWDDLRREYPELEPDDIRHALAFAARNLDDSLQPLERAVKRLLPHQIVHRSCPKRHCSNMPLSITRT